MIAEHIVILLSDKRSGSTIFQKEMCKHPKVRHVSASRHTYYETQHWLKAASLLEVPSPMFLAGTPYYPAATARQYISDVIEANVPDFDTRCSDRALVFDGWEALADSAGSSVFFEKSPHHLSNWASLAVLLEWIEMTDRKVSILGLVRNPMAVLHSAWKRFGSDPGERQFAWSQTYLNWLAFKQLVPSEAVLELNYESIIEKPRETFEHVCAHIGIESHSDLGSSIRSDTTDKWRNDTKFVLQIDPYVAQVASRFGYSSDALQNPPKPALSWSERVLSPAVASMRLKRIQWMNRRVRPAFRRLMNR
ncbi:MAG: sulfotransferase [Bacteroidota bacterium]